MRADAWRTVCLALGLALVTALVPATRSPLRSLASTDPAGVPVLSSDRAHDPSPSGAACTDRLFPVTVSPDATAIQRVFGRFCSRGGLRGRTVLVLLHGASYNRFYWDWPYQPERYSFVRAATLAGYATLDLDRLGYGDSDHPAPQEITLDSDAWVATQISRELRAGGLGAPVARVVLVGHSMGGYTAFLAAGRYPDDFDGVVVSAATHVLDWVKLATVAPQLYPAEQDPKFRDRHWPPGYTTFRPGTHSVVYWQPGADPAVEQLDEELKDTVPVGEWETLAADAQSPTPTDRITAPVLVALGEHDDLMCVGSCADPQSQAHQEYRYYSRAACYELYIQPNSGHMNNLHLSAPQFFTTVLGWVDRHVGSSAARGPTRPCR